jgi:disulfide bond formation protein DsbB
MEIQLPVWVILGLVLVLCVIFRAVRAWIVIVAIGFGLYVASTHAGHEAKKGGDQVVENVNRK